MKQGTTPGDAIRGVEELAMAAIDSKKVDTRVWAFQKSQEHLQAVTPADVPTEENIITLANRLFDWATQDPR